MPAWTPLLDFWFGEIGSDGLSHAEKRKQWFVPNEAFDQQCATLFEPLLTDARKGTLDAWLVEPRGYLAFIVLTDQMPRNIYRGSKQAFAWDDLALKAAKSGIEQAADRVLSWDERSFFYMPFEHSEVLLDQHIAVGLFSHLRDESPKSLRETTGNSLRFAQQHRDIIVRFGRFPHRNAVMGRASTDDELEFIADSDGFGQTTNP